MTPALLVVDMQNGFCHPEGSYGRMGFETARYRSVVPAIAQLLQEFRERNLPILFTKATREASGIDCLDRVHAILPASRRERIRRFPLCVRGTWDADVLDELAPADGDLVVEKRRDSAFQDTELAMWLRALRVDTLLICGIDTYICVESTLRDGFNRGYDVVLVEDAVASTRPELHRATLEGARDAFGLVLPVVSVPGFLDETDPAPAPPHP